MPEGKRIVSSSVEIVDNKPQWVNILEDIPQPTPSNYVLTARQLRLGLVRNGVSLSLIQGIIDSIEDPIIRDEAQIYWEFSSFINWDHPMTQTLIGMIGIPQENIIDMWMQAKDYEL